MFLCAMSVCLTLSLKTKIIVVDYVPFPKAKEKL